MTLCSVPLQLCSLPTVPRKASHKHSSSPTPSPVLSILPPTWMCLPCPPLAVLSDLGKPDTHPSGLFISASSSPWNNHTGAEGAGLPFLASFSSGLHGNLIFSSILGWPSPCSFPEAMIDRAGRQQQHFQQLANQWWKIWASLVAQWL